MLYVLALPKLACPKAAWEQPSSMSRDIAIDEDRDLFKPKLETVVFTDFITFRGERSSEVFHSLFTNRQSGKRPKRSGIINRPPPGIGFPSRPCNAVIPTCSIARAAKILCTDVFELASNPGPVSH
jgi:hypothetical protein